MAIDVHDRTLFVVAVDVDTGEELCWRRFPHTPAGIAELRQRLASGDAVVMEATRGAHSLANRLETSGAEILLADPQRCRLLGFRGKKIDYRDCLALLSHLAVDRQVAAATRNVARCALLFLHQDAGEAEE